MIVAQSSSLLYNKWKYCLIFLQKRIINIKIIHIFNFVLMKSIDIKTQAQKNIFLHGIKQN